VLHRSDAQRGAFVVDRSADDQAERGVGQQVIRRAFVVGGGVGTRKGGKIGGIVVPAGNQFGAGLLQTSRHVEDMAVRQADGSKFSHRMTLHSSTRKRDRRV
jgi:hypothetical protein